MEQALHLETLQLFLRLAQDAFERAFTCCNTLQRVEVRRKRFGLLACHILTTDTCLHLDPDAEGRMARDPLRHLLSFLHQLTIRQRFVHQVDFGGLARAYQVSREKKLHRVNMRDLARQAHPAANAAHGISDLGEAEFGAFTRNTNIRVVKEIEDRLTQAIAIDRADQWLETIET